MASVGQSPLEPVTAQPATPTVTGWRKHRKAILGVAIGASLGLAYHYLVGCSTGACPISARWWTSSLYGGVMGWLVARSG